MIDIEELMAKARSISWERFGKKIAFYHPGMFRYYGKWGKYPAISITGDRCELQCDHCKAKLLEPMIHATTPEDLIKTCRNIESRGDIGCLITGGFSEDGTLPWDEFLGAIKTVKEETGLHISVHGGMIDLETARRMKDAGIDQVMLDVIGDDDTMKKVLKLDFGTDEIVKTLSALREADLPVAPHIVVGLDYGNIRGEYEAIQIIKNFEPESVVIVSLMPLKGTPMENVTPPAPEDIARIIATVRIEMPDVQISLGCARDRSNPETCILAVDCGVNRIALPSDEAINKAQNYGLDVEWQGTCCSVPLNIREVK